MAVTKIFWSGRSQAVRIPKEFRLQGTEAVIRRVGGSLVIEPIAADWAWIDRAHSAGGLDVEAEEAAVEHVPMAERSAAETYFSR